MAVKQKYKERDKKETMERELVRIELPEAEKTIPIIVAPLIEDLDLIEWAKENQGFIGRLLLEHKSILFRSFNVITVTEFCEFVKNTSNGELLEYNDRSTPRKTKAPRVYTSTIYRSDQRINLHNEGTYWISWPLKIYFFCIKAAQSGGETPIADVSKVFLHIDPRIREHFIKKKVMYVRNYNDGFGLPWQEVFQTSDKSEVEIYCRKNCIEFEWKGGDRLRTRQIRPAVRRHPQTNEMLWFNHGAFFHISALEEELREVLLNEFSEKNLPYNTYYGDGTPIELDVVAEILNAYEREKVVFAWKGGDVLLQDNMLVAHGREPYLGDREVIVAMAEAYGDQAVTVGP